MNNRWMQLIEAHVEKGILGLTALFMAYMLWAYLIQSPNTASYNNKTLGPRELAEAVKQDADRLENAMRAAQAPPIETENFSEELKKHHNEGIFAAKPEAGPVLAKELPRAASFGMPIVVPGLEEAEAAETSGNITLAPPLRTSQPKTRTGRSLAVRQQLRIESAAPPGPTAIPAAAATATPTETPKPVEVGWVTIAAYYDKKAQYDEMIKAGYATYRANAYLAGVEAQRQEMLATGEYSEWEDVKPGDAMPKLDLPTPQFDDTTGELINKSEIRQAYDTVKSAQTELYQPPFFMVEAGDFWEVPPIEGYEDSEEEVAADDKKAEPVAQATPTPRTGRQFTPTAPGGRRGGRSGGAVGPSGPGPRTPGPADVSKTDTKLEGRKAVRENFKLAKQALGKKEYEEARRLAQQILGNPSKTKGDERKANELIKTADRWIEIREKQARGGRGMSGTTGKDAPELVMKPETKTPAVWFHDDTVEPGKTYRYRLRVKLWNRYVGLLKAMKDPEQAKQSVVRGEWSLPTDPVTVTPSTYFFVNGGQEPDLASFDVWKWRKGNWYKQRFDVKPGDVIGETRKIRTGEYDEKGKEIETDESFDTGAVVLNIQFNDTVKDRWPQKEGAFAYRDQSTITVTYLDPADGQVKIRDQYGDRNDPKSKELRDSE